MVRDFKHDDLHAVAKMALDFSIENKHSSGFESTLEEMEQVFEHILCSNVDAVCYVSEIDGDIAGFIVGIFAPVWFSPTQLVLQELAWYMKEKYRNSTMDGIRLLKKFEEMGKIAGAGRVILSTIGDSECDVAGMLSRMGYRVSDIVFYKEYVQ